MLKNRNVLPPHLDSACRWWHHRQEHFCTRRSHSRAQALDRPNTTQKTCSTMEPPWTHPRRCLHRNPPTHFFFLYLQIPPQKVCWDELSPPSPRHMAANGNSSEISFLQSANQAETKAEKPHWNNPAGAHRDAESCLDVRRALMQHTSIKSQLLLRAVAVYLGENTHQVLSILKSQDSYVIQHFAAGYQRGRNHAFLSTYMQYIYLFEMTSPSSTKS